ncbi:OmpA family protein [Ancylomarina sp. 16SWW S1-10-2]|uniref:OmpA family protein n=1 Tax=Ancylomarina sp. 16SWW S1-10-2 TaxID=2499681 RepID=UPI0012AD7CA6|nr:OmpA family protein [Ancylomarina sp. 16SWW S1-10-2]MRT91889.1 hypothetical protein [Ancylomarina sp. 16SWW S1-10-2]
MYKKLLTTIFVASIFILTQASVFAQNKDLEKGLKHFAKNEYNLAIPILKEYTLSHKDKEAKRILFKCYIETKQNKDALAIGKRMAENTDADPIDILNYADLLKGLHKYEEAEKWYIQYSKLRPSNKIVFEHIKACKLIKEINNDSLYITKSININTPQTDYATSLYKDGIILVSGRSNKYSKQINRKTKDHYFNLYFSKKAGTKYTIPQPLSSDLNSKYHEGSASFSSNEKFIYFSRNRGIVDLNGQAQLQIYMSRHNNNEWDKPELFQYASDKYSTGHPSISKDGKTLYFISNMPGGYGGTDIYYCKKRGFSWGPPINLGPSINTLGNEMFPYIDKNNTLYFASSGHVGFGGLDIFKSIFVKNHWSYPVNIGYPFNSDKDDFAYLYNEKKKIGYFSSNRDLSDDIFEFQSNPKQQETLKGRIAKLSPNKPIDSVAVFLVDNNIVLDKTYTNSSGNFSFNIFKNKKYSLIIKKEDYKMKRILYFPQNSEKEINIKIRLEDFPWAEVKAFVKNQFSSNPIEGAKIEVVNKTYNLSNYCETDINGNFSLGVDKGNFYDLIISKPGYFTTVLTNYTYDEIQSIDMIETKENQTVELQTSTFPNHGWRLSEITKGELNNVIEILTNNPDILIEVTASTNTNKGTKDNDALCLKRATEAMNYMISKGISSNRIKIESIGFNTKRTSIVVKLVETF